MYLRISLLALGALALLLAGPERAEAQSCSTFAKIESYDASANTVQISFERGQERKFFPVPEGTPRSNSKLPSSCKGKVKRQKDYPVKLTGGRMSVTQVRANFSGKMLNDTDDPAWLPAQLKDLIEGKTEVIVVLRPPPGEKEPYNLTTIYLPITDEELAEIKRLEEQAEDV